MFKYEVLSKGHSTGYVIRAFSAKGAQKKVTVRACALQIELKIRRCR
jgi:hypothetical protein